MTITALLAEGYEVSVDDQVSGETTLVHFDFDNGKKIYVEGEKVKLTATLGPNVTLKSVTVTPASDLSNIISIDANTDNVYTFDMPESNVTVTYDYYLNNGSAAYDITWTGGEGIAMLAQVDGIKVINANAGDVVTITLSDDMKRQASDVTVKGATSNNSVNVTRASIQESIYTFTMPSEAVTVAATFKSAIYLMTANHCTIEASVNGGTPTLVDGLVGAIGADKNDVVTLTVTPTVEGEAISQTALTYTTTGGENVTEYATKVDATNYKFAMPDDVTVTVMPISAFALADDADNSSVIVIHNGDYLDVMLQGRTLYRNGNWNTLCLPFDLKEIDFDTNSADKVPVGDTHPLRGATVMVLDNYGTYDSNGNASDNGEFHTGFNDENSTLYLYFKTPEVTEGVVVPAGTPFIIKWAGDYVGSPLVAPTICGVTIDNVDPAEIIFKGGKFVGNYSPVSITGEDKSVLFLSEGNTLYYPNASMNINSFRAHFQLNGIEAGDVAPYGDGKNSVSAFVLGFGDGLVQTGIMTTTEEPGSKGYRVGWYSLDGRKLSGKPTTGLYILGSKKVYVK